MSTLQIKNLHVQVATNDGPKPILKGATLTVSSGTVHAIMGPNGSGKSTLAYSIAGHPDYEVTDGEVLLDGQDLLEIMRNVDQMSIADIELAIVDYANKAKSGKIAIEDLTGGTFSITNGGTFGSMMSTH